MKILIALDESPVTARAAREAVRLFSGPDAEFLVINVARSPLMWAGAGAYGMVAPLVMDPALLDDDDAAQHDLVDRAEAAGLPDAAALTATGDPVRLVCLAAPS